MFNWETTMMTILKLIGFLFVCLWSADFLTGFFHWMEDTSVSYTHLTLPTILRV